MRVVSLIALVAIMVLPGCNYKLMSKEDRVQMITQAMIVGYQMGAQDCAIPVTDLHLRDLMYAETER